MYSFLDNNENDEYGIEHDYITENNIDKKLFLKNIIVLTF